MAKKTTKLTIYHTRSIQVKVKYSIIENSGNREYFQCILSVF